MQYLVTGIKEVDFKNDKNEQVKGTRLYFIYQDDFDESVTGSIAESKWFTPRQIEKIGVDLKPLINKKVDFVTNLKGQIIKIVQEQEK